MSDDSRTPAPVPRAGQDDDDDQQQTDDEERMLDGIAEQKELIDALPRGTSRERLHRAPHAKKLGQLEFRYQFLVERKRLARELSRFEEKYGAVYSEPCLICLDNIPVHASEYLVESFSCCRGFICRTCAQDTRKSEFRMDKCPLCRQTLAKTDAEAAIQMMALAKRGVSSGQWHVGQCMMGGCQGFEKQRRTGIKWIKKAAAQNHPPSLYTLSDLYRNGLGSPPSKSREKADELLLKAANLGHALANTKLASYYVDGTDGFEKDPVEAHFRASIAFALDEKGKYTATWLGYFHLEHTIPEPSPYLACYYCNIAACNQENGLAGHMYSKALSRLYGHLYHVLILGFDAMPAAFFWARKSRGKGCVEAMNEVKQWEIAGQKFCANCSKEAQADERYKQCSKCRSQWYCSKECQVEAWRAGHKRDCKRATIQKFEDYLNAE